MSAHFYFFGAAMGRHHIVEFNELKKEIRLDNGIVLATSRQNRRTAIAAFLENRPDPNT